MIMKIERASGDRCCAKENKPCENAVLLEKEPAGDGYFYMTWGVEINTLEDLRALVKECKHDVILSRDDSLLIYDDWLE